MVRHSKNNTASGVFTYAERQMTEYGTQKRRLGRDSKQAFDSCYLCLATARTPMVCGQGHVACRECVVSSILEQKQMIERANQRVAESQERQRQEDEQKRRERDAREISDHGRREAGLLPPPPRTVSKGSEGNTAGRKAIEYKGKEPVLLGQRQDNTEETPEEKDLGGTKLCSFWVPSLAPSVKPVVQPPKAQTPQCLASSQEGPTHALRLKSLVEVRFRISGNGEKLCPACDRPLLNSTKIDVLPCGHAMCHRCLGTFVAPSKECFVCQAKVKSGKVIRIDSEGTGFAGGGGQMVASRYGSSLQA
ncbi:hypothetical protein GGF46_001385 [Coemansia sp. RSA 552]|nr:hypothetical protein GGF46_001385 [Coemansia sp. RSA 552]